MNFPTRDPATTHKLTRGIAVHQLVAQHTSCTTGHIKHAQRRILHPGGGSSVVPGTLRSTICHQRAPRRRRHAFCRTPPSSCCQHSPTGTYCTYRTRRKSLRVPFVNSSGHAALDTEGSNGHGVLQRLLEKRLLPTRAMTLSGVNGQNSAVSPPPTRRRHPLHLLMTVGKTQACVFNASS